MAVLVQYFLTYHFYLHCRNERNVHSEVFVMHFMSLFRVATKIWIQGVVKCFWSSEADNQSILVLSGVSTQAAELIWKAFPFTAKVAVTHTDTPILQLCFTPLFCCVRTELLNWNWGVLTVYNVTWDFYWEGWRRVSVPVQTEQQVKKWVLKARNLSTW